MTFPSDFRWGVATASYQIEGAVDADGRGATIWDTFSGTPGKVRNADTGDMACDFYHRYPWDIAMMRELGIKHFRMSLAWSRMFPNGDSKRNSKGFDFYDRVIDCLLEAGIEPNVTLYHWDLPQALQDKGGWPTRAVLDPFEEYAHAVGEHFGDRVKRFAPLNEPSVFAFLGYSWGVHAPGIADDRLGIAAAHHTVVAHNRAMRALRATVKDAQLGPVLSQTTVVPDDFTDPDQMRRARELDDRMNLFLMEGLLRGRYPQSMLELHGGLLQDLIHDGDLDVQPIDWLGSNYYFNSRISHGANLDHRGAQAIGPLTDFGWPITPNGLLALLLRWTRDYGDVIPELYITENGAAYADGPDALGRVRDERRIAYLREHLSAVSEAIDAGAPVKGYYQWSLLDNFEWAEGFAMRFGIVHVDYATQRRTIKDSARWYADVIARNGVGL